MIKYNKDVMRIEKAKEKFKDKLTHSEDYYVKVLLEETKVKEVMTTEVTTINVHDNFSKVVDLYNQYGFRHLPVMNDEEKIVGVLSKRDLFKIKSPRKLEDGSYYYDRLELNNFILSEVMTAEPFTLHPDDPIGKAIVKMVEHKYGCIPIVEDDRKLKGIITQMDILEIAAVLYVG